MTSRRAETRSETEAFTDDGEPVATLSRGPNRELRIRWRCYNDHWFLDVREWSANPHNGQWWPEKGRGLTIKPRELEQVAKALAAAIELRDAITR